jgi:hypothetical protein
VRIVGRVSDLDVELPEPRVPMMAIPSHRFPAVLLWAEEPVTVPDDASEAALLRLRAEALKAIERVEAATEEPA